MLVSSHVQIQRSQNGTAFIYNIYLYIAPLSLSTLHRYMRYTSTCYDLAFKTCRYVHPQSLHFHTTPPCSSKNVPLSCPTATFVHSVSSNYVHPQNRHSHVRRNVLSQCLHLYFPQPRSSTMFPLACPAATSINKTYTFVSRSHVHPQCLLLHVLQPRPSTKSTLSCPAPTFIDNISTCMSCNSVHPQNLHFRVPQPRSSIMFPLACPTATSTMSLLHFFNYRCQLYHDQLFIPSHAQALLLTCARRPSPAGTTYIITSFYSYRSATKIAAFVMFDGTAQSWSLINSWTRRPVLSGLYYFRTNSGFC